MKHTSLGLRELQGWVEEAKRRAPDLDAAFEQALNRPVTEVSDRDLMRLLAAEIDVTTFGCRFRG